MEKPPRFGYSYPISQHFLFVPRSEFYFSHTLSLFVNVPPFEYFGSISAICFNHPCSAHLFYGVREGIIVVECFIGTGCARCVERLHSARGDAGMQQFFWDTWVSLNWPSMILGPIIGLFIAYLARKALPTWNHWRESTKVVLHKINKVTIEGDLEKILKFKNDQNFLQIWIGKKVVSLLFGFSFLILILLAMTVVQLSPYVYGTFEAKMPWGMNSVNFFFGTGTGLMVGLIVGELVEFLRVTKYYTNFAEFKKRAGEILSEEEVKVIEKMAKAKTLRK